MYSTSLQFNFQSCELILYFAFVICRLLLRHNKRPDAVQTFDLLTKLELWNGNSGGIHVNSSNDDLQNQLTQVTDELKLLKMQLSPKNSDSSIASDNNIADITFEYNNSSQHLANQTLNYSLNIQTIEERITSIRSDESNNENEDKDMQIQMLTKKLDASDRETSKLKREIERLRDMIKQQNV